MIALRPMTPADVPLGLHLSERAGWNQLAGDWQRFLDQNLGGCFVAELDGVPAGTACTFRFGSVAWVALVLVEASLRGRGLGTALMRHTLDWLAEQRVATIRLDASPLGEPIYRKLGFLAEYPLVRMDGVLPADRSRPAVEDDSIRPLTPEWLPPLTEFDRDISGTDRGVLLHRLAEEFPRPHVCLSGKVGSRAT